uniref:Uncharacterized protein n=1 Tax=Arundo donax TaxID=35708 RepID=A0A0A9CL04_ARUDO
MRCKGLPLAAKAVGRLIPVNLMQRSGGRFYTVICGITMNW